MQDNIIDTLLLPEVFLPKSVKNVKDLYKHRSWLKQLLLQNYTINYLVDIIITAVEGGVRFRTLECLKVIKIIQKNNPFNLELDCRTVGKLFYLYKTFIFHKNNEVKASVNLLIRNQYLSDDDVAWLISHWDLSEHTINRLLRYPVKHHLITQWAEDIYRNNQLPDRISEVVALLIDRSIPTYVTIDDIAIIWAIYYSRVSDEIKKGLLMQNYSNQNLSTIWEVAIRLGYSQIIEFLRLQIKDSSKNIE